MMAEKPEAFGLTEDEWAAYLFQYFQAVQKTHGKEALDKLKHITTRARHVKEDYYNATGQGDGKSGGGLGGVPERGAGGTQETSSPKESGGQDPGTSVGPVGAGGLQAERADEGVDDRKFATQVSQEDKDAKIPPEIENLENHLDVRYKQGPHTENAHHESAVASVSTTQPHLVEINDIDKFKKAPLQTRGHEIIHIAFNQLPSSLKSQVPPDDPNHPYDISQADQWRAQGKKIWQIPQEVAATLVQRWIAMPQERKKLQPWIDDLRQMPMSVINQTAPNSPGIVQTPRTPVPPVDAWQAPAGRQSPQDLMKQAAALQQRFKQVLGARQ
jgi:hypothetical protein